MSDRTEFWLVLFVAFAFAIWNSLAGAFAHGRFTISVPISDPGRLLTCAFQLAILGFVVLLGKIRGWSVRQLGLRPSWRLTAMGTLLFPAMVIIMFGVYVAIYWLTPSSSNHPGAVAIGHPGPVSIGLSIVGILATSIINPLFEETLVCGYIIQRLANKGAGVAITFSAFVRFLYHTYQGPASLGAVVTGLVFGYLFWRYRQLWPLIVAHSLMDLGALLLRLVWRH